MESVKSVMNVEEALGLGPPQAQGNETAEPQPETTKPVWRFVKKAAIAAPVKLPDGKKLKFRLVKDNRSGGFLPVSLFETEDPALAEALKSLVESGSQHLCMA